MRAKARRLKADQGLDLVQSVENIAPATDAGQGQLLAGTDRLDELIIVTRRLERAGNDRIERGERNRENRDAEKRF